MNASLDKFPERTFPAPWPSFTQVEGGAGGCERNGAKLISERLWEDCLEVNPGTGGRIRQQAGSHRTLSGFVVWSFALWPRYCANSHRLISYKVTATAYTNCRSG